MERRLLDSNIIIYSIQPQHYQLMSFLKRFELSYSKVSMIEVLGFHLLPVADKPKFQTFFSNIESYDITDNVINKAVDLKQSRKMSLGDSIVAATAIVHKITLLTRNTDDFQGIPKLTVINPFDFITVN